jgi:hypothetical protein
MLRASLLANAEILPQARQGLLFQQNRPKADGHLWATANQQQSLGKSTEFVEGCATPIHRLSCFGRSDPFSDGVSRRPGTPHYLMQRHLAAKMHPQNFTHHFHAVHPVLSCSKVE